jgi:hypothetical protein
MAHGRGLVKAVHAAVDEDRLLEGEDPKTIELEDAVHWRDVYGELLGFKRKLLSTVDRSSARLAAESLQEVTIDVAILEAERDRLERRLRFWSERCRRLERGEAGA